MHWNKKKNMNALEVKMNTYTMTLWLTPIYDVIGVWGIKL